MDIFIFGINGKMGKKLIECSKKFNIKVVGGFDITAHKTLPTFNNINSININFDAIVDFSRPAALPNIIALSKKTNKNVVLATTGYNDDELAQIQDLSKSVAVFKSSNMSLGIAAVAKAAQLMKLALGSGFDIEILERHHKHKVDSPSGTSLLLANAIKGSNDTIVTDRKGVRQDNHIGIGVIRGGNVIGEHEVGFYGELEDI